MDFKSKLQMWKISIYGSIKAVTENPLPFTVVYCINRKRVSFGGSYHNEADRKIPPSFASIYNLNRKPQAQ